MLDARNIFLKAVEQHPPGAWPKFLDRACGSDVVLRQRVEALLAAHQQPNSLLDGDGLSVTVGNFVLEPLGAQLGPYKLLQVIGEGGMGTVYMAGQQTPVERHVALKIIKPGMDSRQVIARFEAERQALALMDHPHIAKVLDGGTTGSGRPYFVMELVKGVPITRYCDERQLTVQKRLELFIPVCQAIQHAHQKGIIHRDIKPSNVLVAEYDERPVAKIIDFGVAKAVGPRLTERTMFTELGQLVGTLEYMSPEQAKLNQLDIDTRSDIYSLGVLLYELLTGSTPFDKRTLQSAAFDEVLRIIREQEPPRPSTKLSSSEALPSVAANRSLEPAHLSRLVRGELDWIVMKALEKDRNRRYETANGLAHDVQRYLHDEPVQACPPSAGYRLQKFARRNRGVLAIASLAAVTVLLAMVGLAVSNVLITQEKNQKVAALKQAKLNEEAAKTQRGIAERNAINARDQEQVALANEKKAKASELLANRRYYAAQMNLAMQAWRAGEMPRVLELLEGQRPKPDAEDLRGFEWFYLWRLCQGGRRVPIRGHDRAALGLAFSPDGKTLASASWDWTVRLWDTATGQELKILRGDQGPWEVAFSPDGKILASSGQEAGSMILWDVGTGKPLQIIAGSVMGARFTPDGTSVVGGHKTDSGLHVKEWEVVSGQERTSIADAGFVIGLSTDRGTLITSTGIAEGSEIRIWDWPSGKRRLTIPVNITTAASSPDGSRVAVSSWGAITLWDTATGTCVANYPLNGTARSVAFSPDGKRLAAGLENRRVVVYDIETGTQIAEDVHLDSVWGLAFSPDSKSLASSTLAGAIKLWDMTPAEEATTISGIESNALLPEASKRCLQFTRDGKSLLVGSAGLTRVIDVAAGKEIALLPVTGVGAISADANVLAGRGGDQGFELWDVRAGRKLPPIPFPKVRVVPTTARLSGDGGTLAGFRPWGSINTGHDTVTLQDVATRQSRVLRVPPPESNTLSVLSADFSPDGKLLAAGYQFQWVVVWDLSTEQMKLRIYQQPGMMVVHSVEFSPDSKSLAVGTDSGAVTLWDLDTGEQRVAFRGHTSFVHALAFSPDGCTLATAGADKTVRLWDVVTGQERGTLTGHTAAVTNVAFSPDGFTLATAGEDRKVKLWYGATDAAALAPRKAISRIEPAAPLTLPPGAIELTEEGLRQSVLLWPDEPALHMRLAQLLMVSGRKAAAEPSLAQAAQLAPDNFETHRDRFMILRDLGKFPEAEEALREAIRLKPTADWLHVALGQLLAQQRKLPEALAAYQEAVRLNPSNHNSRVKVAWTLFDLTEFVEAESAFREMIRLMPDLFEGHHGLGRTLVGQNKHADAAAPLQEAIRLNPNNAGAHGTLGWVHMKLQQFPEAEAAFREQARLSPPNSFFGLYGLGKALLSQAKPAEALVPLAEGVRLEPANHQMHDAFGWALLLTGECVKAEAEFREVIQLKPELATGHWGLGRALVEQQKYADAEVALREALRLEPAHPEVPNMLRRALLGQGKQAEADALLNEQPEQSQHEPDKKENAE